MPFFCDRSKVGSFAVSFAALASGNETATFRLFVALSMYQALRDVVIMRHQRCLHPAQVAAVAGLRTVRHGTRSTACVALRTAREFSVLCNVRRTTSGIDCSRLPGSACHVKTATAVFNRMGDMGKLPTSAFLTAWSRGGVRSLLKEVIDEEFSPTKRASLLVERLGRVHRVGRKLATLYVSALSTPALTPGLSPWFPGVNGNQLLVIDTNVARAVDVLRRGSGARTYSAREAWLRHHSQNIDLREFRKDVPSCSPRIIQQAIYKFCSKSNRAANGDMCSASSLQCAGCVPRLCPFGPQTR